MLIEQEELEKIIKYYRLGNDVEFVGYQWVEPDTVWYYFRDRADNFYLLEASDYIMWIGGHGNPPEVMKDDYYEDANVSFPIEKWLTCHDNLDYNNYSGDYEGYVYWAKNSDRCIMAKVKGKFSDYKLENITKELPHYNQVDVATYAKKRIESELVSLVPRPEDQDVKLLSQKICNSIQDEIVKMAERLTILNTGKACNTSKQSSINHR